MNDTTFFDDDISEISAKEKDIIGYLKELKLSFLTDPQ